MKGFKSEPCKWCGQTIFFNKAGAMHSCPYFFHKLCPSWNGPKYVEDLK